MYISLRKKIFYALFTMLVFTGIVFFALFFHFFAQEYQEDQSFAIKRNHYIVELLHENVLLRRELTKLSQENSEEELLHQKEAELSKEKKINDQLQQNYNQRWNALIEGAKIIGLSSLISLILIIILGFLLQRWIIVPLQKLFHISLLIAKGDYSQRLSLHDNRAIVDELDTLAQSFNIMIENVEKNIETLKNTESFLQLLIDSIPDGIRVIDHDYNVIMTNRAYRRQTGDLQDKKCYRIYSCDHPCPENFVSCPLKIIQKHRKKSISTIHSINGKPLLINAAPFTIRTQTSETFFVVEILRDLSEDIRFSHEQKISSLGFLATSVAHEMKNNLGAIRMILESLLNADHPETFNLEETQKYLKLVYQQIVSSIEMPERLLRLARHSNEEGEAFNVNEAITEVLSLLDYEAKRNGISVSHFTKAGDAEILGSTADFKMIILNLAQNAIKAMPDGGEFQISVSKNQKTVNIEIKDNGIGIPHDKIQHIFEPFYSDGQRSKHKGTGLGLAIVKSLVEKYKGNIEVFSQLNKGTTFSIKFPKYRKK